MIDERELGLVSKTSRGLPVKDSGIVVPLLNCNPAMGFGTLENGIGASTGSIEQESLLGLLGISSDSAQPRYV